MAGTPPDDPYDDDLHPHDPDEFQDPADEDRQPGRPAPEVYRRRQLFAAVAALLVLALVIGLVAWVVGLLSGGRPDDAPSPTATTSPAAAPTSSPAPSSAASASATDEASGSASPSAGGSPSESGASSSASASVSATPQAQDCQPQDLSVSGATDQSSYGADQTPVLELRIENVGDSPCVTNVGSSQQRFTVTSGSDRVFSTEDCQVDGQDVQFTLKPGVQETARFTWDRTRSAPECRPVSASPGAGTYRLEVSLGEISAQPVAFTLQ